MIIIAVIAFIVPLLTVKVDKGSNPPPPPIPLIRTVKVSTDSIDLSWDSVGDGFTYLVHHYPHNNPSAKKSKPENGTSTVIPDLASDTEYSFWVTSVQDDQEREKSSVITVTTMSAPLSPLPIPLIRTVKIGIDSINLSWDSVGDGFTYRVHHYPQDNPSAKTSKPENGTSTVIPNLASDTEYSFWVTSVQDGQEREKSSVITVQTLSLTPPAPSNVEVVPGTDRITLNLESAGSGFKYRVHYWKKDNPSTEKNITVDGTSTVIRELASNTKYSLQVTSVQQEGRESEKSLVLTIPTLQASQPPASPPSDRQQQARPPAPSNVEVVPGTDWINLSWESAGSGFKYRVHYWKKDNPSTEKNITVDGTSTVIRELASNTKYSLQVMSVQQEGRESEKSLVLTVPTLQASQPPDVPQQDDQQLPAPQPAPRSNYLEELFHQTQPAPRSNYLEGLFHQTQ